MASKQTDARTAIIALMRDNRERTFNDIFNRVRGDENELRSEIRRMIREGILTRDEVFYGSHGLSTYMIAQAAE